MGDGTNPLWENSPRRSVLHLVTNEQIYILVGVPMLFNATLIGLVVALFKTRFDGIDKRFDDMRDLWRAELRRVEEVLDARLKHIEERG